MFTMNAMKCAAMCWLQKKGVLAAALVAAGMLAGWGLSTTTVKSAAAAISSVSDARSETDPTNKAKAALVGTYVVTGTDPDGNSYIGTSVLEISLAPSGALELSWDNGKTLGVGQFDDNVLSVALLVRGRTAVLIMKVNTDGSLSGTLLRRTDRGSKGSETWKKA